MSNTSRMIMMLVTGTLLAACSSAPKIQTDYDHTIDFSQFKTYGYFSPMGIENPNYSSILGQMFRNAIDAEMQPRGYVKSENPDILINVSARLQDKTRVTTTSDPMYDGYYGYRGGLYDPKSQHDSSRDQTRESCKGRETTPFHGRDGSHGFLF